MKEFKIGDRVKVYGSSRTGTLRTADGLKGTVRVPSHDDGYISVELDGIDYIWGRFHEKQIRRLKPSVSVVYAYLTEQGLWDLQQPHGSSCATQHKAVNQDILVKISKVKE